MLGIRTVLWGALVATVSCSSPELPPECLAAPDKACVPKCCPDGYSLQEDRECHNTRAVLRFRLGEDATSYAEPGTYILVYGNPCKGNKYPLDPSDSDDYSYLLQNGSLVVPALFSEPLGPSEFCLETLHEKGSTFITPFICFPDDSKGESTATLHFIVYPVGLLISVPFLITTVLVYTLIPCLGDLHGKALCSYCSCLAVAYFFLACVQLGSSSINDGVCSALAFIIQFFFMACFFWLNILCIDTFWCILTVTGVLSEYPGLPHWEYQPNKERWMVVEEQIDQQWNKMFKRRVFLCYSLYAWCLPLILLAIVVFLDLHPTIPSSYVKPHMGYSKCWFSSDEAALRYFYAPIAFLLSMNLLLFVVTIYKVLRFNWNPSGPHRFPKQKARMCLFLFLAMGVSWMFEIVSWAVGGPPYVWVATDALNILQGVVIFGIYVLEPRVRWLIVRTRLWNRLVVVMGKYWCCRHHHQRQSGALPPESPPSPLASPQPDEDNTMLTVLDLSFQVNR